MKGNSKEYYILLYNLFEKILKQSKVVPPFVREYKFYPNRKWRIDFAWPSILALEIEGGSWVTGRHTRGSGFAKDMEKYNALAIAGYRLLRITPQQIETGDAIILVELFWSKNKRGLIE